MSVDDSFQIYLVSNVANDIFPNNGPSKFSTILAEDIHLEGNNWEVAVKNIIFPSNVASTSDEDTIELYQYKDQYRQLYPQTARWDYKESLDNSFNCYLNLSHHQSVTYTADQLIKRLNKEVGNQSLAHVVKFRYQTRKERVQIKDKEETEDTKEASTGAKKETEDKKKETEDKKKASAGAKEKVQDVTRIIMDINPDDLIVSFIDPILANYLGFKSHKLFMKGRHIASNAFDSTKVLPKARNQVILLNDLQSNVQEKCVFNRSFTMDEKSAAIYSSEVDLKYTHNKDDALLSHPQMTINIMPDEGKIQCVIRPSLVPDDIKFFENQIKYIVFDKTVTAAFNLKPVYDYTNWDHDPVITFYFPKIKRKVWESITAFNCTVYYEHLRELTVDLTDSPIGTLKIKADKSLKQPDDFLEYLNQPLLVKYGVNFTYNPNDQRFYITNKEAVIVRLSSSLATILGFSSLKYKDVALHSYIRADEFPVLDRAITSLYVYSNIVQSVFIGNVKAPLLLTCPFRKDKQNNVSQLEFLNPTYTRLNRSTIHQIDIGIYDEAGSVIPFLYGKSVLTLAFRKM